MSDGDKLRLNRLEKDVSQLFRETSGIPVRFVDGAGSASGGPTRGVAAEFIGVDQSGDVTVGGSTFEAENITGYPIWDGAQVTVYSRRFIIDSDSAHIIAGEYDAGTKTTPSSWTWQVDGASRVTFNVADVTDGNFDIVDPAGILTDVEAGGVILFSTGGDGSTNILSAIGPGAGDGGGGFPGWPGPDPETGTATVSICRANVNDATDVAATDATFAFDNPVVIVGTVAVAGNCDNPGYAFCDNEDITIVSRNGGGWAAFKDITNWIKASVNGAITAGTATGTFDGVTVLAGVGPATSPPVFHNIPARAWLDNEEFIAFQRDDKAWQPITTPLVSIMTALVDQAGGVTLGDATYTFDNGASVVGTSVVTGTAKNTFTEYYADNEPVMLVQRADNGLWETIKKGQAFFVVKGLPTANIVRTDASITCNSPTAVVGRIPVGAITAVNDPKLKCLSSDTVYFVFDLTAGAATTATRWSTAHMKNILFWLHGLTDYAVVSGEYQVLGHDGGGTDLWLPTTICNPEA